MWHLVTGLFTVRALYSTVNFSNSAYPLDCLSSKRSHTLSWFLLDSCYFPTPDKKVLADKMPARTLRRVPGQYSEELRMLLNKMLNLTVSHVVVDYYTDVTKIKVWTLTFDQDYPRPSTDSILQSNLLAEAVGEEEKKGQLWLQRRFEKAERDKRVFSSLKNKENLAPSHPQTVMPHNIARRLQTDDRHASRVDNGSRSACRLRFWQREECQCLFVICKCK